MKTRKLFIVLIAIMMLVLSTFSVMAKQSDSIDKETVKEIKVNLKELGIDDKTSNELINKLLKGEKWDSFNAEKVSKIAVEDLIPTYNDPVKRVVFEDGSVILNELDFSECTIVRTSSEMDILNIANAAGASRAYNKVYYNNVKVSGKKGLCGGGFYADYYIDYAYCDSISAVRDSYINVVGGSYSNKILTLNREFESTVSQIEAEATLNADISYILGIGGAETFTLKMYVAKDTMHSGMLGTVTKIY